MQCKSYSHFFSKKFQHICVSLNVNFNESLLNDVVSFEQLGPDFHLLVTVSQPFYSIYASKAVFLLHFFFFFFFFFFFCASVVSYLAFVLSLFVPHISFFWCLKRDVLHDCDGRRPRFSTPPKGPGEC